MIQGYLTITFGCILNVYSLRFGDIVELSSYTTSSLFLVIWIMYPLMMFILIYDNRKDLMTNRNYIEKYGTLFKHLKNDGCWYTLQFYPIFLVKRLIFVISLIILEGIPEVQCNIFIFSSLCVSQFLSHFLVRNIPVNSDAISWHNQQHSLYNKRNYSASCQHDADYLYVSGYLFI